MISSYAVLHDCFIINEISKIHAKEVCGTLNFYTGQVIQFNVSMTIACCLFNLDLLSFVIRAEIILEMFPKKKD